MKHHAVQLYEYHIWANERIFQQLKELPEEACRQEIQSIFPSVYSALVHIYTADHIWLYAMAGESFEKIREAIGGITEETNGKSAEELQQLFRTASERYKEFLAGLPDLDATTQYRHPTYGVLETRYSDIVQHVVNHGTYHRGNIAAMLRQQGYAGVPTDYVFYLYELSQQAQA
ncbi:DinB family protein [Brevibacillus borstelensis]|uniref:DinB family protein n=1 Tax=Brevibacillus borstelensis TaxID=45462 RepID=UPI00203E386B|nr:DinB family protein [Brevibacillus borstelensis]MCM3624422.1 DinB family protein [Brevibacillus borstelensis]